jgi:hypothetical protein
MTATSFSRRQASLPRRPVTSNDVRGLGGVVSVHSGRDLVDGSPRFSVGHISKGGDCCWRSLPMVDEDQARSAARILAEFVGGVVK